MSENKKLREALQRYGKHDRDCGVNNTRFNCACNCGLEAALALPTADHIPDAGEKVADHLPNAGKMIETAAPVGEREAFENEMRHVDVWGHRSLKKRASGNYENWQVNLMWDVWQARAALSAGDAVDAQRYRWLKGRSQVCLNQVWIGGYTTRQRDSDFLSKEDALSAIDAAIDAAMRKGQL